MKIKYPSFVLLFLCILSLPATYFGYKQVEENQVVEEYLADNGWLGLPLSKELAVAISQKVRADFNVNESSFQVLDMGNRPFLRQDTTFLLTHKEGLCGEGTRVLVNLLRELGYDATRVNLFNSFYLPHHTLVSVNLDDREFFIDSINTREWANNFLNTEDISTNDFKIVRYSGSIQEQNAQFKALKNQTKTASSQEYSRFFERFKIYSYDALPMTKLLSKVGLDVKYFNLNRPPAFISALAEKPNLIMFIVLFAMALVTTLILHYLRLLNWVFDKVVVRSERTVEAEQTNPSLQGSGDFIKK